jgi:hypothetical protein
VNKRTIFKVGDRVKVVKEDCLYESYSEWASRYGLDKFKTNNRILTGESYHNREGIIIKIANHLNVPRTNQLISPLYAIDIGEAHIIAERDAIDIIQGD